MSDIYSIVMIVVGAIAIGVLIFSLCNSARLTDRQDEEWIRQWLEEHKDE